MRISDWSSDVCSSDLLGHGCSPPTLRRGSLGFQRLIRPLHRGLRVRFEVGEGTDGLDGLWNNDGPSLYHVGVDQIRALDLEHVQPARDLACSRAAEIGRAHV